ncbi:unnamed protein product, partial [Brenthis ino]
MKRFWTSCKIDMLFNIEVLHDEGIGSAVFDVKGQVVDFLSMMQVYERTPPKQITLGFRSQKAKTELV